MSMRAKKLRPGERTCDASAILALPVEVRFFVEGIPAPGGSKTPFIPHRRDGSMVMKNGRPIVNMVDAGGKRNKLWRKAVAVYACRAMIGRQIFNVPLRVSIAFVMLRPANHFGTGKNASLLKTSAPEYPAGPPDVLKCARSTEDAMTGIIYIDDALICVEQLSKDYGATPGAWITVAVL